MNNHTSLLNRQIKEHRSRAQLMQLRLEGIDDALRSLGVVLWSTDRQLRLLEAHGTVAAEPFLNRPIGALYRDLFDVKSEDEDPVAAHYDAARGHGVTLCICDARKQYAMIIEPKRNAAGQIVGTVGISIELGKSMEYRG